MSICFIDLNNLNWIGGKETVENNLGVELIKYNYRVIHVSPSVDDLQGYYYF